MTPTPRQVSAPPRPSPPSTPSPVPGPRASAFLANQPSPPFPLFLRSPIPPVSCLQPRRWRRRGATLGHAPQRRRRQTPIGLAGYRATPASHHSVPVFAADSSAVAGHARDSVCRERATIIDGFFRFRFAPRRPAPSSRLLSAAAGGRRHGATIRHPAAAAGCHSHCALSPSGAHVRTIPATLEPPCPEARACHHNNSEGRQPTK